MGGFRSAQIAGEQLPFLGKNRVIRQLRKLSGRCRAVCCQAILERLNLLLGIVGRQYEVGGEGHREQAKQQYQQQNRSNAQEQEVLEKEGAKAYRFRSGYSFHLYPIPQMVSIASMPDLLSLARMFLICSVMALLSLSPSNPKTAS
ncbi:hypothetical protein D3C71_1419860 [compost metagenome]